MVIKKHNIMEKYIISIIFVFSFSFLFGQKTDKQQLITNQKIVTLKSEKQKSIENKKMDNKKEPKNRGHNEFVDQYNKALNLLELSSNQKDTFTAFQLVRHSAIVGQFPPAYYSLGKFYKLGIGVTLNLDSSFYFFDLAAKAGHNHGQYLRGYMLYKGLGCEQDYIKAVSDFRECANKDNRSCMYMLGLCYRNGFGVAKDIRIGDHWLQMALEKGSLEAKSELDLSVAEVNDLHLSVMQNPEKLAILSGEVEMKSNVFNKVKNNTNIGNYGLGFESYLVKYDYSEKYIVSLEKIDFSSKMVGNKIDAVVKFDNGNKSTLLSGIRSSQEHIFALSNSTKDRNDRYTNYTKDELIFDAISFFEFQDIIDGTDVILANISGVSTHQKEPEKPIKLFIFRETDIINDADHNIAINQLLAYPNPFTQVCNVEIDIAADAECSLLIHDMSGRLLYHTNKETLKKGKYIFPWESDALSGTYIVTLNMNNVSKQLKIIKI